MKHSTNFSTFDFPKNAALTTIAAILEYAPNMIESLIAQFKVNRAANDEYATANGFKPFGNKYIFDKSVFDVISATYSMMNETGKHAYNMILLSMVIPAYHDGGKIAGITSIDSTCNCAFCDAMSKCDDCICSMCYARKERIYRSNVAARHDLTAAIMSFTEYSHDELKSIVITNDMNRFNSDGDLTGPIMAMNYFRLATINYNKVFTLWFKNKAACNYAVKNYGIPSNMVLIYSNPSIKGAPAVNVPEYSDYVFTVYPTKKATEKAIDAGAIACNGKSCIQCGYKCYHRVDAYNRGLQLEIAEKLRGGNKR